MTTDPAREPKPAWESLSPGLRSAIELALGSGIEGAEPAWGGFAPSATFRLRLRGGREVFCKADHPGNSEMSRVALRAEIDVYEQVPGIRPLAPGYLGTARAAGERTGAGPTEELALLLEWAGDREAVPPWDPARVEATLERVAELHSLPIRELPRRDVSPELEPYFTTGWKPIRSWDRLAGSPELGARFAALFAEPAGAREWLGSHADRLAELERGSVSVDWRSGPIHLDLRSDNLLYTRSRGPLLIDWTYLALGPRALDVAFLGPSVEAEGGPAVGELVRRYERIAGLGFTRPELAASAALVSGFFAARAPLPDLPPLPRLRQVQCAQLFPALRWLSETLEIPCPGEPAPV